VIVAVLDTNTIVSGMLAPRGIPKRLLDAAWAGQFALCASPVILAEVFTTLGRDRITRKYHLGETDLQRWRDLLEHETISRAVTVEVRGVATHPEDDLVLATAVSTHADDLVTGDNQLQKAEQSSHCGHAISWCHFARMFGSTRAPAVRVGARVDRGKRPAAGDPPIEGDRVDPDLPADPHDAR
jgi:putative PIN family toxin of toxin-antitoxin system